jgi:hypothetical protein
MFFACLGYIASQTNRALKGTATGKTALRSELADTPKTGVNKANFDRIRTGMTYAQVVAILGQSGEELSRSELAGIVTIMYSWKKPLSIGNMNAMFQNGKLVSKAQFGL